MEMIEVVSVTDYDDGSAIVSFSLSPEGVEKLLAFALREALTRAVKEEEDGSDSE